MTRALTARDMEFLRSLARALCIAPKDDDFYLVNEAWIAAVEKMNVDGDALLEQAERALQLDGYQPT